MFRQGYRLCSIDRYQPWVRLNSPPYLITLLHPHATITLNWNVQRRDETGEDRRWNKDKARSVISVLAPNLCCHRVKSESYGVGGSDIIGVGGRGGRGVLRAGCVREMTSSVNGMLAYKWLSADLRVSQPCLCLCAHLHLHRRGWSLHTVWSVAKTQIDNRVVL